MSETTPTYRTPLWLKVTLFGSLALNLVVVGLVVGAFASGGPSGPAKARIANQGATPFVVALEKKDRRTVGREVRQALGREAGKGGRGLRRALNGQALEILRAQEFDGAAFQEMLAQQARVTNAVAQAGTKALTKHLAQMSFEERIAYADRVEDAFKRGPRGKKPRE